MQKTIRFILLGVVSIFIIVLGFARDSLFKHINHQLYQLAISSGELVGNSFYQALFSDVTYYQLYVTKWVLTIFFSLLFYVLTVVTIRIFYATKKFTKLVSIIFIAVFVVSAIAYGVGYVAGYSATGYRIARLFMGGIQSPFIMLIMLPGIKIMNQQNLTSLKKS